MSMRPIINKRLSKSVLEGAGVRLDRAFGFGNTSEFDPFLLLDDFRNNDPRDYQMGFPWHPHRGIETITYILKGSSKYEADDGSNDDLVMCLVLFAWLSNQTYFKELTDSDIRARLYEEQRNAIEQDMAPFGFVQDGISSTEEESFTDPYGQKRETVKIIKGQ